MIIDKYIPDNHPLAPVRAWIRYWIVDGECTTSWEDMLWGYAFGKDGTKFGKTWIAICTLRDEIMEENNNA